MNKRRVQETDSKRPDTQLKYSPVENGLVPVSRRNPLEDRASQNVRINDGGGAEQDWPVFLIQWRVRAEQQHQEILREVQQQAQGVIEEQKENIFSLEQKLDHVEQALAYVQLREMKREQNEKAARERKALWASRTRIPARNAAALPEFQAALEAVNGMARQTLYTSARDKCALLALFITGLRIGNLLHFTVNHLETMRNGGILVVPAIKSKGGQLVQWPITPLARQFARNLEPEINLLLQGKTGDQYVFTAQGKAMPLHKINFIKRINGLLKVVSATKKKKVSSHSFRIGKATALIDVAGIEIAQKLLGHKNIATTAIYNRNFLSEKQARGHIERADHWGSGGSSEEEKDKKKKGVKRKKKTKDQQLIHTASATQPVPNRRQLR